MRRRILLNYRVAPEVAARQLPAPFRPKIHRGHAIAGVCLLRLEQMRPVFIPGPWGIASENALHRFAVEWEEPDGTPREGVYIARRDTNSPIVMLTRGKLLPGDPHLARFQISEDEARVNIEVQSYDRVVSLQMDATVDRQWPSDSCFQSLTEASRFCETGTVGYSRRRGEGGLEGFELKVKRWQAQSLHVNELYCSYFEDKTRFPAGSIAFDNALLLLNVTHEWVEAPALAAECAAV